MCVIIAKREGVDALKEEYFSNAWDKNPDGGGIVWKEKGKQVMFQKGFMKKEEMLAVLNKINKKDTAFIAHFRIKSVGDVKPENCHPFVMKNITFAHNGTLSIQPMEGKTDSETFGRAILYNHTMKWIKSNQLLLELALGSSKFAIMDNKNGEIFILNEDLGKEKDGAWFSNESAFTAPYKFSGVGRWIGSRYVYDNDDYDSSATPSSWREHKTVFMPDKTLGTKNFQAPNQYFHWDDAIGAWWNPTALTIKRPYQFSKKIVVGRNGLWRFEKSHRPGADLDGKKYSTKSCPEYSFLMAKQNELNRMLAEYKDSKFDCWDDRDDFEMEIHALALVLNASRRLVSASKSLSLENMIDYIYTPVTESSYGMNDISDFLQILTICIENAQDEIEKKTTKLNDREVKQVCACVANA